MDLTASANVAVRWQAQMEEHLSTMRALGSEAMLPGIDPVHIPHRVQLAQAHAVAALALAIANGLGDLEMALSREEELYCRSAITSTGTKRRQSCGSKRTTSTARCAI